jgi:hypothetical protein
MGKTETNEYKNDHTSGMRPTQLYFCKYSNIFRPERFFVRYSRTFPPSLAFYLGRSPIFSQDVHSLIVPEQ